MDFLLKDILPESDRVKDEEALKVLGIVEKMSRLQHEFNAPIICPSCGAVLVIKGVDLICANENCREKKLNAMNVFLKKLKIKNVDVVTLRKFGIVEIEDLLVPLKKYEKSKILIKLISELDSKLFTLPARNLFCAMNFSGLSETLLNKIIDWCGWELVETGINSGSFEKTIRDFAAKNGLPMGIGEIMFEKFIASAEKNFRNVELIMKDPRYVGSNTVREVKKTGISVCFTGSLNTMGRSKAIEKATEAGFEVKSSVSKGLTYLVTNDTESGSSKNVKAKSLGTKIINEEEFLKLLNTYNNSGNLDEI